MIRTESAIQKYYKELTNFEKEYEDKEMEVLQRKDVKN